MRTPNPRSVRGRLIRRSPFLTLGVVFLSGLWPLNTYGDTYEVVLNHAPPYRIIDEQAGIKTYAGFYVDFVRELAKRQNLELQFHEFRFVALLHSWKMVQQAL